mgnify:CR=1 FL=1
MANAFEYVTDVLEIIKDADEDNQAFFQRVAFELQNLSEEDWNKLPVDLQDWYNKAAEVLSMTGEDDEPGTIDMLPGMVKAKKPAKAKKVKEPVEEVEEVIEIVEDEEVAEKPKRGRKPKADKAPKEPKVKKEKAPKEPKEPKGPTAANAVREILCENMDRTLDEIMTELEARGVAMQRSSMQVVALNTVRAFEMAIQVGEVRNAAGNVVLSK